MDRENFEELISLSIGELREKLAYEDSEATFESFLVEYGWIDEDREWDTEDEDDDDYEEENDWEYALDENGQPCVRIKGEDDYEDEDWEDDEPIEGSDPLENPEEEELALGIADDIVEGRYDLEAIRGLYSDEIIERINYLKIR